MRHVPLIVVLLLIPTLAWAGWWPTSGRVKVNSTIAQHDFRFPADAAPPDGRSRESVGYEQETLIPDAGWGDLDTDRREGDHDWWDSSFPPGDEYMDCSLNLPGTGDSWTVGTYRYPADVQRIHFTWIALKEEHSERRSAGKAHAQLVEKKSWCPLPGDHCNCMGPLGDYGHFLARFETAPLDGAEWHQDPNWPNGYCIPDPGSLVSHGNGLLGECWDFNFAPGVGSKDGTRIEITKAGDYRSAKVWALVDHELRPDNIYRVGQRVWVETPNTEMKFRIALEDETGLALWIGPEETVGNAERYVEFVIQPAGSMWRPRLTYYLGKTTGVFRLTRVKMTEHPATDPPLPPPPPGCNRDAGSELGNGAMNGSLCWIIRDPTNHADFDFLGRLHAVVTPDPSMQYFDVEVAQPVGLVKDEYYKIAFTAWSDRPNTMLAAVGERDDSYHNYGYWQPSLELHTAPTSYSQVFRVGDLLDPARTDFSDARIVFCLGQVTGQVWIDDVRLDKVPCTRTLENLLATPDFSSFDCWQFQNQTDLSGTPGDAQLDRDGDAAHIVVNDARRENWMVQLRQERIPIRHNKRYELTYEAKGPRDAVLTIGFSKDPQRQGEPWVNVFAADHSLMERWQSFRVSGLYGGDDFRDGKLRLACGKQAGEYWIRDIRLAEHCPKTVQNAVASGTFGELGCWDLITNGERTEITPERQPDGALAARARVTLAGDPLSIRMIQDDIVIAERRNYELTFQIKGTTSGLVRVLLGQPGIPGASVYDEYVNVSPQWTSHRLTRLSPSSFYDGQLAFGLARQSGEYWIKNVELRMLPAPDGSRDKLRQPFASTSIWNMPIGTGAHYEPATLENTKWAGLDVDYFIPTTTNDPIQELKLVPHDTWDTRRCDPAMLSTGIRLHVPRNLVVPDVVVDVKHPSTPNNAVAFLQPDGNTLVQCNALARCQPGDSIWGVPVWKDGVEFPREALTGDGITGGHGGSLLSSIGGTIRRGELISPEPIQHVLKVEIFADSLCWGGNGGFRWPAQKSDRCWTHDCDTSGYYGTNANVQMGSLLAIPWDKNESDLGLKTEVGRRLFYTLKHYGAYLVDNSAWRAHVIAVEDGVREEAEAYFGYSIDTPIRDSDYFQDFEKIFLGLAVVTNNDPEHVGGGGTPRVKLAPALDDHVTTRPAASACDLVLQSANPTRAELRMEVVAPMDELIRLVLYSVTGRQERVLFEGFMPPGRFTWSSSHDVASLPPGVYFAKLLSGRESVTKRVVILH